jgi:uncharacterized protein YigE (DUF2233 family)
VSGGTSWRIIDIAVDVAAAELRVVGLRAPGSLLQMVPASAVAAVNGGYFDEKYRPTGWLADRGNELAPRSGRPSGGVLAVARGQIYVGPLRQLPFEPEFALQNGPRLIEGDGQLGIRSDDGKRAARTVACEAAGRLHLIAVVARPHEGPTLFEIAHLLAEPGALGLGCRAALNLDGGPSTGAWLKEGSGIASSAPLAPIAYGIAVVPR